MIKPKNSSLGAFRLGLVFVLAAASATAVSPAQSSPAGHGQLENAPVPIPGGMDSEGRNYSYLGQLATNQKIILTASNGFFTSKTCTANGESSLPKVGDEGLIVPNFEYLDWKLTEGSLRWHILVKNPGSVRFQAHVAAENGGAEIEVSFAGQTKNVTISKSASGKPQPWDLDFEVGQPGEYEVALR
ncbi:MAG: hypothetical protein AAF191_11625, partial [Verrucomicrobiota bacterium]